LVASPRPSPSPSPSSQRQHPVPERATSNQQPASTARQKRPPRHFRAPVWLRWPVIALSLLPAAWIAFALWSDLTRDTRFLGANPVKEMEHFMGEWNIRFLVLTLAVSPLIKVTGWGWLIRYRRIFGLLAFFYIFLHLTIYFVLDAELSWSLLVEDVSDRLYITLGMAGFLLLVPLAITSTKGWIKRLGNKRWNALHWLIFPAVVLGMIHYYMAVKRDIREPLVYALIFAFLFWFRLRNRKGTVRAPKPV
jgi:sulfoxide reductase heme-binding subunit YedZ